MQDFIYYSPEGLEFPVSEEIFVTTNIEDAKDKNFIISNTDEIASELTAKEIDFYIKNSQDILSNKIKNVSKLYEIAVTKYDSAQDISYSQKISKELLLITNTKEESNNFILKINADDFELYTINETILKKIEGHIGNLKVTVDDKVNKTNIAKRDNVAKMSIVKEGEEDNGVEPIRGEVNE